MKELGIENEHVEYSIKKEKREGEESTKQKNHNSSVQYIDLSNN